MRRAEINKQIESLAEQIKTCEEDAQKAADDLHNIRDTDQYSLSSPCSGAEEEKREAGLLQRAFTEMQQEVQSGESGREAILKEQQAIEAALGELRQKHAVLDREQAADEQRMRHMDEWLSEGATSGQRMPASQIAAQEAAGHRMGEGEITLLHAKSQRIRPGRAKGQPGERYGWPKPKPRRSSRNWMRSGRADPHRTGRHV